MVYSHTKWVCGSGVLGFHYCEICNTPYQRIEDALECEESHRQNIPIKKN